MKDKLIASFMAFENKGSVETDTDFHKIRSTAIQQFEKVGFPTKKIEDWKYTSLKSLLKNDYSLFPLQTRQEPLLKDVKKYFLKGTESFNDKIESCYFSRNETRGSIYPQTAI